MAETKKILIVDDEKPLANALMLKLSNEGFSPTIAGDGEEVLKLLESESFDLMLLDLMMPKMDGFGVLAELQKRQIATPVIVTSNLSQDEDKSKALQMGAKEYIVKSDTSLNEIVQHIKTLLSA